MRVATAAVTAALALALLCAGIWLGGHPAELPSFVRDAFVDETATLTGEAAETIEDNYFRSVPRARLNDSALGGMVAELRRRYRDRFSHYFGPEALDRFEEATEGRFSGVGLSVSEVPRGLRVADVFAGAPAEDAGIEPGDLIVSVEGKSIAGDDSAISTASIKGPAGTSVTLGVLRPASGRRRTVTLERAEVTVPVVERRLVRTGGTRLGYVRLLGFTDGSHAPLRRAVQRLRRLGAQGLVLDLRGNGGGLLREAILSASIFLSEGEVVVRTRSRTQGHAVQRALGGNLKPEPMVVLINRDTASAAEILASALADNGLARTVGTRSFGKGVFQQVIDLSNGGALDLTIGRYFTASGISLAPKGIRPDVRAPDDPRTRADEQLRRALGVLRAEIRRR